MIRPDKWVIIEWTKNGNAFKKVLAGYTSSQSWELSHIVDNIEDMDDYWEVSTREGNIYKLVKHLQGMSPIMLKIYNEMSKKATTDPEVTIGIISI